MLKDGLVLIWKLDMNLVPTSLKSLKFITFFQNSAMYHNGTWLIELRFACLNNNLFISTYFFLYQPKKLQS